MKRLLRWRDDASGAAVRGQIAVDMLRRADAARDAQRFTEAAMLYGEVLRLWPQRADLHEQHGNMLKESGDLIEAGCAYYRALELKPRSASLHLQLGHFFKTGGEIGRAVGAYERADALAPSLPAARHEADGLKALGWGQADDVVVAAATADDLARSARSRLIAAGEPLQISAALAPGPRSDTLHGHGREIAIRGLGRRERTAWGVLHTLRGVRAIRGFCISDVPIARIHLLLNGRLIYRSRLKGGFVLPNERENPAVRKYTFNAWIDFGGFATGRYELEYRAVDVTGEVMTRVEQIVIAPPFPPSALPDSDNAVSPADPADPRSLDQQIDARPSMVRNGRRALLSRAPRTVLVMRPDVLGDLVVAVPALRRLRELLPGARLVGLLSPANVDFGRSLNFFDEIILTELLFDSWERRRVVTAAAQEQLAADLARFQFDMAIDLGTSQESRLLMPLSGAPVLVGFSAGDMPNLTVEVAGAARDPYNGIENVPHTNQALGLIEWLAAMMRSEQNLLRRDDLQPAVLESMDLAPDARFVVLHSGGRWPFTRWPYFADLARMLLAHTDLQIVLLTGDATLRNGLPADLTAASRFRVLDRRLAFDELDALASFCTLFVGDDSGVKHLAAMRGAKVIGIQNARNNWCEWGQENGGYIITRKVPCAGCLIQNYPESDDCGRDFVCLTGIRPEEVFAAAEQLLRGEPNPTIEH